MNNYMPKKLGSLEEINTSLETYTYNLWRLNCEETETLNRTVMSNEIVLVIKKKKTQQRKFQYQKVSLVNSTKHLKINHFLSFLIHSQKMKRKEHSQTHFMRPALPWYESQTRTLQDKKTTGQYHEYRCENSQQNTTKLNSTAHWKNQGLYSSRIYPWSIRWFNIY